MEIPVALAEKGMRCAFDAEHVAGDFLGPARGKSRRAPGQRGQVCMRCHDFS
jgi:hypothetical protein